MSETKKMAIIVHSGTLDKLYPVFMLASSAGAIDLETHLFFTFWGLEALKKNGLENAKLPGVIRLGPGMMKGKIKEIGVPSLPQLLEMTRSMGVTKIYACSTTMEIMGVKNEELIPEVDDIVGATAFLDIALDADIQLFI